MAKDSLHDEAMIEILREDPLFAQDYLNQALLDIDEEGGQQAFLLALRHVTAALKSADAYISARR
ncbi:DNA-binding phage protein [Pantoea coffeiphila]|nr:DNA-binding phage protein [Pantoea coffeiphila]